MISFIFSSLIEMLKSLSFLTIFSPFKYFESAYIQNEMMLEPFYLFVSIIIIIASLTLTLTIYPKRDLYI